MGSGLGQLGWNCCETPTPRCTDCNYAQYQVDFGTGGLINKNCNHCYIHGTYILTAIENPPYLSSPPCWWMYCEDICTELQPGSMTEYYQISLVMLLELVTGGSWQLHVYICPVYEADGTTNSGCASLNFPFFATKAPVNEGIAYSATKTSCLLQTLTGGGFWGSLYNCQGTLPTSVTLTKVA